jgi:hypothetical protein
MKTRLALVTRFLKMVGWVFLFRFFWRRTLRRVVMKRVREIMVFVAGRYPIQAMKLMKAFK